MSQLQPAFDPNQLQLFLTRTIEYTRVHPFECFVILAVVLVAGRILKHLIAPSAYPNISGPPRKSLLYGHLFDVFSPHIAFHDELQENYGSVSKVYGLLGKEDLYVSDPRFLHEVLVKESDTVFRHPQSAYDFNAVSFGQGLLATTGDLHKAQRKMLNPVFTAKHMKSLAVTFETIAQNMKSAIIKDIDGAELKEIDMLRWCSLTALELIGQAGLGHTFGALDGVESAYSQAAKSLLPAITKLGPFRGALPLLYRLGPAGFRRKLVEYTPNVHVQKLKEIIDIQDSQAQIILDQKKKALKNKQTAEESHDIMSLLLKANMEANEGDRLPEDQLLGQMNTLIFAGHETTSGALARILQILSLNPSIQDRLRAELLEAPDKITYDDLHSLEYLDALCRETLRLFPAVPYIERQATKDWTVPLRYSLKGNDGKEIKEIRVRKGTKIYVALREANRCKETWGEDALEFRPERWLQKLPSSVSDARTSGVYSSMMTFSAGPRACIGFKFSLLELKIVLSTLVKSFKFTPATAQVSWHACGTMVPYLAGMDNPMEEGGEPTMPLGVSIL